MREMNVLILTSYELIMSFIFGVVTIVLATKTMNKFVMSLPIEEFIRRKQAAGCIIGGALVFAVIFLTRGSVEQSTLALQSLVSANHGMGVKPLLIALAYFVVFYFITFFLAFVLLYAFSIAYRYVMREIDIDDEIENGNNVALSIFLAIILLGLVLFIDKPLSHMLGGMVFHEYLGKL